MDRQNQTGKIPSMFKYRFRLLKEERERRMLTRTELAKRAGVSCATVSMVERGKGPWLKAIRSISEVLGVKDVVKKTT